MKWGTMRARWVLVRCSRCSAACALAVMGQGHNNVALEEQGCFITWSGVREGRERAREKEREREKKNRGWG